jgi:hypothetical protein
VVEPEKDQKEECAPKDNAKDEVDAIKLEKRNDKAARATGARKTA